MNDIHQAFETPATEDTAQVLNVYRRHMRRRGREDFTADDARRIGMMLKLFDCEGGELAKALETDLPTVASFSPIARPKARDPQTPAA